MALQTGCGLRLEENRCGHFWGGFPTSLPDLSESIYTTFLLSDQRKYTQLLGSAQLKFAGVVNVATPLVRFDLRVRTEWTREHRLTCRHLGRRNHCGRGAFSTHCSNAASALNVSDPRPGAVIHPGHKEEAHKFLSLGFAALVRYDAVL